MTDVQTDAPVAPGPTSAKEAKASAKAAKAHAKALRPWYKKKRFMIPLVLVVVMVIATAASGGGSDDGEPSSAGSESAEQGAADGQASAEEPSVGKAGSLYPDRPDQQGEDQEAAVGESVRLSGYTTTLTGATYTQEEFTQTDLVIVDVRIENRDETAQPYNTFDFRIQTPNGQVLDPSFIADNSIGSGDLVGGGVVEGNVGFEVGPGTYYVIYKPDPFDAARGVWQITVG